ncbi:MAG: hypothetical protein ACRC1T_16610 [Clostridium chrysemydis]|uniref:hypothetical protein n=1 Tax=Clostridium chrysemydis TaxID=2665504 RepID=UPI003F37C1F4
MLGIIGVFMALLGAGLLFFSGKNFDNSKIRKKVRDKEKYIMLNKRFGIITGGTAIILGLLKLLEWSKIKLLYIDMEIIYMIFIGILFFEALEFLRRLKKVS